MTLALPPVDPKVVFDCLKFFPEFPPFKVLVAVVVVIVVVAPATAVAGDFEAKYAWALVIPHGIFMVRLTVVKGAVELDSVLTLVSCTTGFIDGPAVAAIGVAIAGT